MIRVLVVDDSPLQRELLVETLRHDPRIEVVGTAADGQEALERVRSLRPDLITMDVQMPRMDGYAATEEIMIHHPTPIVIVSGSKSRPDMEKTMNSLRAGALTVLAKPSSVQSVKFDAWARNFLDTVVSMSEVKVIRRHRRAKKVQAAVSQELGKKAQSLKPKIAGIVSSTGGPQALFRILSGLPADYPLPIVAVQHIGSTFLGGFAAWLNNAVPMNVEIGRNGATLRRGTVFLAPEGQHMGVNADHTIHCWNGEPIDGFRPSGTALFHSLARSFGSDVLGIILTGMGRDGVDGLESIHRRHGHVIAQDEKSSIVYGMPRSAIEAGLVNQVLSLDEISLLMQQLGTPSS